jgi:formamidopyrimidine-DNA glycosylase
LKNVLEARDVRIEFCLRKLRDVDPSLQNKHIQKIEAHGKQFRIHFPNHRILLIHLMMWGSWRIYRKGELWDKPIQQARVIFHTDSQIRIGKHLGRQNTGAKLQLEK